MTFIPFDNMEEAFEAMAFSEAAANYRVLPQQAAIDYGDHFMRTFEDLLVFGRVYTREELLKQEDEETMPALDATHQRGYRYSWCSSVVCPEGEPGDVHVSQMIPITQELYENAKEHGWLIEKGAFILAIIEADMWPTVSDS